MASGKTDILIAGGGLAGSLATLALADARPDLRLLLLEAGAAPGGNHIWSFFDGDVAAGDRPLIEPLVERRWTDHEVSFPARRRTLPSGYSSITSARLAARLGERLGSATLRTGAEIVAVAPDEVRLADGSSIAARTVIDARGPGDLATLDCGWQKFVGRVLRTERPHGVVRPMIMDATVRQVDGYRFVYLLPFDADRLLVEDTYYSDDPTLDPATLAMRIDAYAEARGWRVAAVEHEEAGVLPVVMGGDFAAYWSSTGEAMPKLGLRAGLFHPTTGYSLPDAVRTARLVAANAGLPGDALARLLRDHARRAWDARGFYRLLDRMLFRAAAPTERYRVLERFYGLSPGLVARFYAGRSTLADKMRVVTGRPPVPFFRGLKAAFA